MSLSSIQIEEIVKMNKAGFNNHEIAEKIGSSAHIILYQLNKVGLKSSGRRRDRNGRIHLVMDGLKECPQEEMHSFIKKPALTKNHALILNIPKQIVKTLNYQIGEYLLIAIKKASQQEVLEYQSKEEREA